MLKWEAPHFIQGTETLFHSCLNRLLIRQTDLRFSPRLSEKKPALAEVRRALASLRRLAWGLVIFYVIIFLGLWQILGFSLHRLTFDHFYFFVGAHIIYLICFFLFAWLILGLVPFITKGYIFVFSKDDLNWIMDLHVGCFLSNHPSTPSHFTWKKLPGKPISSIAPKD